MKRTRSVIKRWSTTFPHWNDLLPEMLGEVVSQLDDWTHLSLSLTSHSHLSQHRLALGAFDLCMIVMRPMSRVEVERYEQESRKRHKTEASSPKHLHNSFFYNALHQALGRSDTPLGLHNHGTRVLVKHACLTGSCAALDVVYEAAANEVILPCAWFSGLSRTARATPTNRARVLDWFHAHPIVATVNELGTHGVNTDRNKAFALLWRPDGVTDILALVTGDLKYYGVVYVLALLQEDKDAELAQWRLQTLGVEYMQKYTPTNGFDKLTYCLTCWGSRQLKEDERALLSFIQTHKLEAFLNHAHLYNLWDGSTDLADVQQLVAMGMPCSAVAVWQAAIRCHASEEMLDYLNQKRQPNALVFANEVAADLYDTAYKAKHFDAVLWLHAQGVVAGPNSSAGKFVEWCASRGVK